MNQETKGPVFTVGSGNVFTDLDRPDADELQVKAELVYGLAALSVSTG
jgi:hypothetical protein